MTSGNEVVDELVRGVRVGDNLVLLGASEEGLRPFVDAFAAAARGRPLVVVAAARRWDDDTADLVLDWRPSGEVAELAGARRRLEAADRDAGGEAAFLFDSLTAMQERWGAEAALDLFLWACPRLYRRGSLALWPVDRSRHAAAFLARLHEITQVVVEVQADGDRLELEVLKADGRPQGTVGRRARLRRTGGRLVRDGEISTAGERFGTLVREQRAVRQLSQAELARRVGISPSALSQAERGVRGLAADTLVRIWEVLGVPFGPETPPLRGYRVARRAGHAPARLAAGVEGRQLVDVPGVLTAWRLTIAGGASGRGPLFPTKSAEGVVLLAGVIDLELGAQREVLHDGDTIVLSDALVTGWANPGSAAAELLWLLLRQPR